MKLTGKCKEDFEKWQRDEDWFEDTLLFSSNATNLELFNKVTNAMKYGVYVGFFCENDIEVRINRQNHLDGTKYFDSYTNGYLGSWETRPEARRKAIEKANEIYNK